MNQYYQYYYCRYYLAIFEKNYQLKLIHNFMYVRAYEKEALVRKGLQILVA